MFRFGFVQLTTFIKKILKINRKFFILLVSLFVIKSYKIHRIVIDSRDFLKYVYMYLRNGKMILEIVDLSINYVTNNKNISFYNLYYKNKKYM